MKKISSTIIILVVASIVLIIFCGYGCSSYNGMVTSEEQVNNSWANVQSAYQRRLDLIPNLVQTVKGYAKHEKSTFTDVTAMRAGVDLDRAGDDLMAAKDAVSGFSGPDGKAPSAEQYRNLDRAYGLYINAVHEAYPTLVASENFMDLQKQLEGTENRINTERNRYNGTVQEYNIKIRRFPNNIVASMFGFDPKQMFAADAEAQKAVTVNFDD